MTTIQVDLHFVDADGRDQLLHATPTHDGDWEVSTSIDGETFRRRCDTWQCVERTVFQLRHRAAPKTLRRVGSIAAAVAALLIAGAGSTPPAFAQGSEAVIVQEFTEAAHRYALLHRQAESLLPRLDPTSDVQAIRYAIERLAGVMRVHRRDARQGDFITPALAPIFRERIAASLAEHGLSPADVLADEAAEGIDGTFIPLNVNDSFPWRYATAMLPCLIQALPALPDELQYRIVGYTLVLVDVHASLIVDLLPDALAATELR